MFTGFSGHGNSIHNILEKENIDLKTSVVSKWEGETKIQIYFIVEILALCWLIGMIRFYDWLICIIIRECAYFYKKKKTDTRWESWINTVKSLHFRLKNIRNALTNLREKYREKVKVTTTEAMWLLKRISTWNFLLIIIILHDVLLQVNKVSELLQSMDCWGSCNLQFSSKLS